LAQNNLKLHPNTLRMLHSNNLEYLDKIKTSKNTNSIETRVNSASRNPKGNYTSSHCSEVIMRESCIVDGYSPDITSRPTQGEFFKYKPPMKSEISSAVKSPVGRSYNSHQNDINYEDASSKRLTTINTVNGSSCSSTLDNPQYNPQITISTDPKRERYYPSMQYERQSNETPQVTQRDDGIIMRAVVIIQRAIRLYLSKKQTLRSKPKSSQHSRLASTLNSGCYTRNNSLPFNLRESQPRSTPIQTQHTSIFGGGSLFEYSLTASNYMPSLQMQPSQFKFEEKVLKNNNDQLGGLSLMNSITTQRDQHKNLIRIEEVSGVQSGSVRDWSTKSTNNEWVPLQFSDESQVDRRIQKYL